MSTMDNTDFRSSRFTYHGDDDPGEGGVTAARPASTASTAAGRAKEAKEKEENRHRPRTATSATTPGVPGPDEPRLEISELARTVGMRYTHRFEFPPGRIPDLPTSGPTRGTVRLTNSGAVLLLRGEVESQLSLECARCLELTDETVRATIEEEFPLVASNTAFRQEEVRAVDEDEEAAVIEDNVLDLADLLRQNLLLAAPFQPLCREDCPGIMHESNKSFAPEEPEADASVAPDVNPDNPLKRLAELLEAKRRQEGGAA